MKMDSWVSHERNWLEKWPNSNLSSFFYVYCDWIVKCDFFYLLCYSHTLFFWHNFIKLNIYYTILNNYILLVCVRACCNKALTYLHQMVETTQWDVLACFSQSPHRESETTLWGSPWLKSPYKSYHLYNMIVLLSQGTSSEVWHTDMWVSS